jgi:hypothetical protein
MTDGRHCDVESQGHAAADAPIRTETASDGETVKPRNAGWFTPENQRARKHGLYSRRLDPDVLALIESAESFTARSLADAGGAEAMSARERSQHGYRGIVHQDIQELHYALRKFGLFDGRGRPRLSWLTKLESLMATARAIDSALGLERRSAAAPTLSDYVNGLAQQRAQADSNQPGRQAVDPVNPEETP